METFYIFSLSNFKITFNNTQYTIGKDNYCKITSLLPDDKIVVKDKCGEITINLKGIRSNNYYRVHTYDGLTFIEILGTSFNNVIEKHKTANCEIIVYENIVRLFYDEICYIYSFYCNASKCLVFEHENNLYLVNEINTLIFNMQNKTFILCETTNYKKNEENAEFLIKIPKISKFFIYFLYIFKNNQLTIKKLKKENNIKNLPILELFYLCKFNFNDAKNLLDNSIDFNQIKQYFNGYENIVEFNGKYYIYNKNEFGSLTFKENNGIIIDLD